MQLTAGQGGLQHVAGVDTAFGGAGAHHGMYFIQEQDYLPSGRLHLVHDRLEPFFELTPELGAGDQRPHVQGQDPAVLQRSGHVARDDPGGQALHDGGLAHAGLTDDHGVVLLPAGQGLHHLPDFGVPSHHRVQLALPGQPGEVDAVAFQGAVAALGPRVVHPVAAPYLHQCLVHLFPVDSELLEHPGRFSLGLHRGRDEEVFNGDQFVLHAVGFELGLVHQPQGARGRE